MLRLWLIWHFLHGVKHDLPSLPRVLDGTKQGKIRALLFAVSFGGQRALSKVAVGFKINLLLQLNTQAAAVPLYR